MRVHSSRRDVDARGVAAAPSSQARNDCIRCCVICSGCAGYLVATRDVEAWGSLLFVAESESKIHAIARCSAVSLGHVHVLAPHRTTITARFASIGTSASAFDIRHRIAGRFKYTSHRHTHSSGPSLK